MRWIIAIIAAGAIGILSDIAISRFLTGNGSQDANAETAQSERADEDTKTALFAGGCFWCVEADFDKVEGVTATISGFAGGDVKDPTYDEVTGGDTGHYEVVQIRYNPDEVSYRTLVEHFMRNHDFTDLGGQFCDRGDSYRPAIFASDPDRVKTARTVLNEVRDAAGDEVAVKTPILDKATFYRAEDDHQNYYQKKPVRYRFYRLNCGRDGRLEELAPIVNEALGKPDEAS